MDIIKEFNNKLNNSFSKRNDGKNTFYDTVDVALRSAVLKLKNSRQALIIGAGKMDDFSLIFFMKSFDKVVVTDIDMETTRTEIEKLHMNNRLKQKLITREVEYTGFGLFRFFEELGETILPSSEFSDFDQFVAEKMELIKKYHFLEYEFHKYDFIYVSPIYTQLVYNQILMECSYLRQRGYPEDLLKYIENVMLDEMVDVINRFNDNLLSLLTDDGMLFVLSDIFEVNIGSDFERRIRSTIQNRDLVDSLYEEYRDKYGMGFGDYGLYSLDEKMSVHRYKWLIWPFKEDTNLVVKLKIYNKKRLQKEVKL